MSDFLPLEPYAKTPVPVNPDALPPYLEQELQRLQTAVNVLVDHFVPNRLIQMNAPTGPTSISPTRQPITGYAQAYVGVPQSQLVDYYDQAAGTIGNAAEGDGSGAFLMRMTALVNVNISSLQQNNEIRLYLTSQTREWRVAQVFKAGNQQNNATLSGSAVIPFYDNDELKLELEADASAAIVVTGAAFSVEQVIGRGVTI